MRVIQRGPAILGDRVLRDFARSLRAADLAEATRRGYAADLGRFRAWIEDSRGAGVPLRRINTVDLANYRLHLTRSAKLRAASVNRKVQALKRFFGWAHHKKLIAANPAAALGFLRRQKRSPLDEIRARGGVGSAPAATGHQRPAGLSARQSGLAAELWGAPASRQAHLDRLGGIGDQGDHCQTHGQEPTDEMESLDGAAISGRAYRRPER